MPHLEQYGGEVVSVSISRGSSCGGGESSTASSPPLSVQSPSSPSLPVQPPPPVSPFGGKCTQQEAPDCAPKEENILRREELHRPRHGCGYAKDLQSVAETRLSAMEALGPERARVIQDELPVVDGKRKRVDTLHLAFAPDTGAVQENAQR